MCPVVFLHRKRLGFATGIAVLVKGARLFPAHERASLCRK